jgi:NAD(P)-dependent dehydrogenase (short-subunit alcohol dehydrogenase family)
MTAPLFDLTGKVALITGSSRGIGRAIALRMAEHGARVVISSRRHSACQTVVDEITSLHGAERAIAIEANISSKEEIAALVTQTRTRLGRIDVLVCNAASNPYYGPLQEITDEQLAKILNNNIVSNHWLIQLVAPQMIERGDGAIIIVSSIGGLRGSPVLGAYNISKSADMQLARNYAVELGPHNIRVNCIAPGLIRTAFSRALWENPKTLSAAVEETPLRRIGEPDEMAGAAVFLASGAGQFATGHTLVIDGGLTIASGAMG